MDFFNDGGNRIDIPFTLLTLNFMMQFVGNPILAFKLLQIFHFFPETPNCKNKKCKQKLMKIGKYGQTVCFRCSKCKGHFSADSKLKKL